MSTRTKKATGAKSARGRSRGTSVRRNPSRRASARRSEDLNENQDQDQDQNQDQNQDQEENRDAVPPNNPGGNPDGDDPGGNDGDGDGPPEEESSDEEEALTARDKRFLKSIGRSMASAMSDANPGPKKDKIDKPALFNGKNKSELYSFLASLDQYFEYYPKIYEDQESSKVMFAANRLDGAPRKWYLNFYRLPRNRRPEFLQDYDAFTEELKRKWGLSDEQSWNEKKILKLRMTDEQRFDNFWNEYEIYRQVITDWSDRTWRQHFMEAIAPRIQTWLSNLSTPIPMNFDRLQQLIAQYDENYWKVRDTLAIARSAHNSDSKKDSRDKSNSDNSSKNNSNNGKQNNSGKTSNNGKTSTPSTSGNSSNSNNYRNPNPNTSNTTANKDKPKTTNPLTKVLDSAGKLIPAEVERRTREGLCRYCGQKGHFAKECPLNKNKNQTKARATVTITSDSQAKIEEVQ
jgi:hypothetical protein